MALVPWTLRIICPLPAEIVLISGVESTDVETVTEAIKLGVYQRREEEYSYRDSMVLEVIVITPNRNASSFIRTHERLMKKGAGVFCYST